MRWGRCSAAKTIREKRRGSKDEVLLPRLWRSIAPRGDVEIAVYLFGVMGADSWGVFPVSSTSDLYVMQLREGGWWVGEGSHVSALKLTCCALFKKRIPFSLKYIILFRKKPV